MILNNFQLSKAQTALIIAMRNGWELGSYPGGPHKENRLVLQKGGLGRGGETKAIGWRTLAVLKKLGIVANGDLKYPVQRYHLTEHWKS